MKRSTADRLLEGLKERILAVNEDDRFVYKVQRAVVFGSYVNNPEMDMLGDLDIGYELEPRESEHDKHLEKLHAKQQECNTDDWWTALWWPQNEVIRFIRNRSGYISLHPIHVDHEAIFSKDIIELPLVRTEVRT